MYVYRPEIPDIVEAPYGLKQLVPAVNLAYVGHEQVQQVEFLYRKVHRLPMAYNAAGIYVYCDVPGGDLHLGSLLAGARPAKYGLYSGLYLEYVERLCHVVVRAVFEAQYLIHILALCGEHDYWHVALLPHRLAYFYSAHLGQHNVQQYKIEIAVLYLFKGLFAVSGGKDSHFQVWMLKEVMHMNPILFSVEDNFPMTQAGIHNLKNISEEFGCTIISCKPNIKVQKTLMRKFFEKYGKPTWYVDRLIYTFPLHMAAKFNTPMLCYGENVSFEYGGNADKETYSAMGQIENGVAVGMPMEELLGDGVTEKDLSLTLAPSAEERAKLDPFYMSYFVPWNSYKNYQIAKAHGFHDLTHEWDRTHHAENFDQIDSRAYLVHSWLKYPKFGHAAATDYTARYIRYGMMTREEAIPIIKERDGKLDPLCVRDFCEFCGYTETEFWAILDKFYNRDLFEKNEYGEWQLKHPIWEENK